MGEGWVFFFFFSSRRRHTSWPRDWSSDVCSSDLRIDVELATEQVLVDEDRPADTEPDGRLDIASKIRRRVDDLHAAPAEHVRWPHQYRIAHPGGDRQGHLRVRGRTARRLRDAVVAQQGLAATAVLRQVDSVDGRAENAGPAGRQRVREVQTGLPAELDHHAEHRIAAEHIAYPLQVEGLEVETGRGIEIGADRLGVAIDEHAVEARFLQRT